MKALCLLCVLLLARILVLFGHPVPFSFWSPPAYLWQDLLVVLLFGLFEGITRRRPWISWTVYFATALYVALNLPLIRWMSSPMTLPMWRATRGALADSIRHHLTAENLLLMVPVLGTALPRVEATRAENRDWRTSPVPTVDSPVPPGPDDLSRFKGAARGRNVILILLESTGAKYLRPCGAAEDPMPHLTALASQAILFENAYAVYPESINGLLSVLCSRYPAFDTKSEVCARIRTPAIASQLAGAGYRTALFHSGRFAYLGMEEVVQHRGFQTLEDAGDIGGNHQSSFGVDDAATTQRMLNWIDSLPRSERFFITYLPVAGHHPYDAPAPGPFPGHDEVGRYRNALHYSDVVLGEFLGALKARGLFEKTLFVIFGDHGEAFGQHEGNYGHTLFIYDENVHVPHLIVAPGLVSEPIRVSRVASLIDTAPTILDLLGLPVPEQCQGASLLEPTRQMALFYADYSLGLLGLRDRRWKFIYELESGRSKLFDLANDAGETKNVAGDQPERVQAYRRHLPSWAAAQRELILRPADDTAYSAR